MALTGKAVATRDKLVSLIALKFTDMKFFYSAILALLLTAPIVAQTQTYDVNGTTYELKTEVEGTLTLLWNVIDKDYRYFVVKDNTTIELVNTEVDKVYQEEYKDTLRELTKDATLSVDKVNLTLGSLRNFFNAYNSSVDADYVPNSFLTNVELRLGGFVGVTNSVFTSNPNNESNAQFGLEFEITDPLVVRRHAIVVQYKQVLPSDAYDYSALQLSINHRFKFVQTRAIDVFVNTKLATFSRFNPAPTPLEEAAVLNNQEEGRTIFQGPIIFGLGADVRLGKGFLTFNYHDAVSLFLDSNGEFPVDVSIGYKFIL